MTRRRIIASAVAIALCLVALGLFTRALVTPVGGPCMEDEACWDWRTMGNQRRGVCIDGRWMIEHADGRITDDHPWAGLPAFTSCVA